MTVRYGRVTSPAADSAAYEASAAWSAWRSSSGAAFESVSSRVTAGFTTVTEAGWGADACWGVTTSGSAARRIEIEPGMREKIRQVARAVRGECQKNARKIESFLPRCRGERRTVVQRGELDAVEIVKVRGEVELP